VEQAIWETTAKRQKQRMEVEELTTRQLVCEADVRRANYTSKWNRITPNQALLPTTGSLIFKTANESHQHQQAEVHPSFGLRFRRRRQGLHVVMSTVFQ